MVRLLELALGLFVVALSAWSIRYPRETIKEGWQFQLLGARNRRRLDPEPADWYVRVARIVAVGTLLGGLFLVADSFYLWLPTY